MRVGLFVPCYVDQFYPQVAVATLELLEKVGCEVAYVADQTCCGQPMANSGFQRESLECANLFVKNFSSFDHIVTPSGSCALFVKHHYGVLGDSDEVNHIRSSVYELSEFLTDIAGRPLPAVSFPHRVGLHQSCHGLRGLRLGSSSEQYVTPFNKVRSLLEKVEGLSFAGLARADECCGFGGTFALKEEALSVAMGNDRISDHESAGAEFITGADVSCLMHLEGLIRRQGRKTRVIHFAEILNGKLS